MKVENNTERGTRIGKTIFKHLLKWAIQKVGTVRGTRKRGNKHNSIRKQKQTTEDYASKEVSIIAGERKSRSAEQFARGRVNLTILL